MVNIPFVESILEILFALKRINKFLHHLLCFIYKQYINGKLRKTFEGHHCVGLRC